MQTIDRETIRVWMTDGRDFILVDTLPASTYEAEHMPGGINIVSDDISAQAPKLLPDRSATIVVYCASNTCQRAGLAAERLELLGYTRIFHYEGGKKDWTAAGFPLEPRA